MEIKIYLSKATQLDLKEAVSWYESQAIGLGREFFSRFEDSLRNIQKFPKMFPFVYKNYKKVLLTQFPYAIYFSLEGELEIYIFAVVHTSRHPDYWKKRLK